MSDQQQPTQQRSLTPIQEVSSMLNRMKGQFQNVLPTHTTPEKFIRIVLTALSNNSDLLKCNRQSLYLSCLRAAQDGLLPDGREGAIVPFKNVAQWMPMVGGLCKKARNSGEILSIDACVVYANDEFDSWVDEKGPHFKHRRARADRGEAILTYAYAMLKNGGFAYEEIDEAQMAEIEKMSRASNGPWKGPFRDEMRRKSAIRRLCKYRLPSSTDLDEVLRRDDDIYDLEEAAEAPSDQPPETPQPRSRLSKLIEEPPFDEEAGAEPQ